MAGGQRCVAADAHWWGAAASFCDSNSLCCCCLQMRGYLPAEMESGQQLTVVSNDTKKIDELQGRKQALERELRALEANMQRAKSGTVTASSIPSNTQIELSIEMMEGRASFDLVRRSLPCPVASL